MTRRGFTIVELIITITIMGILLTLAVVNVGTTQVKTRDDERTNDVTSFALSLEQFYTNGQQDSGLELGRYPSDGILDAAPTPLEKLRRVFPDMDFAAVTAPGKSSPLDTLTVATNNAQATISVAPQPTISQYVYQPLKKDGTLCTQAIDDCSKFNIFYRLEIDNTVYRITSKNQ
jgi:prepilin-type N-terminal cleavage/methylation domain-containing protein